MHQLILALLFLGSAADKVPSIVSTLDAIEQVESRGRCDLVGDGGKAIGPLQIWRSYWSDACEFAPNLKKCGYEACTDPIYARRVALAYLARYRAASPEQMARIHNGGPKGASKKSTLEYWKKVRARLTTPG